MEGGDDVTNYEAVKQMSLRQMASLFFNILISLTDEKSEEEQVEMYRQLVKILESDVQS